MSLESRIIRRTKRRAYRVRAGIANATRMRLSVFRSLKEMYVQIIDDKAHTTVLAFSTAQLSKGAGDKKEKAFALGKEIARQALDKGIKEVVLDRGSYLYHGRIKRLAEGLREGGLTV